jgi:Ni/Co efflux regulator RcnB
MSFPSIRSTALALGLVGALSAIPAEAAVVRHHSVAGPNGYHGGTTVAGPRGVVHTSTTVVDRGRPGWWHGHSAFVGYTGARSGYYFAPGYGYYPIPHGYGRTTWVVGGTLPVAMRRYVVVQPTSFGLVAAPAGYGWYYAGTNFVLVALATGVIAQSVAGGW